MRNLKNTIIVIGANSLSGHEVRMLCQKWGVITATANGSNELKIDSEQKYFPTEFWENSQAVVYECPTACACELPVIMNFHYNPLEADIIKASSLGQLLAWRELEPNPKQLFQILSEFDPAGAYDHQYDEMKAENFLRLRIRQFMETEKEGEAKGLTEEEIRLQINEAQLILEGSDLISLGVGGAMVHAVRTPCPSLFCLEEAALARPNFPPYVFSRAVYNQPDGATIGCEIILGGRTNSRTVRNFVGLMDCLARIQNRGQIEKSVDLFQNKAKATFLGMLIEPVNFIFSF